MTMGMMDGDLDVAKCYICETFHFKDDMETDVIGERVCRKCFEEQENEAKPTHREMSICYDDPMTLEEQNIKFMEQTADLRHEY